VIREFGAGIVGAAGEIDRKRLAANLFSTIPKKLARLNALVHPPVMRQEEEMAAEFAPRASPMASSW
jgi:dephospho-CoA kinase